MFFILCTLKATPLSGPRQWSKPLSCVDGSIMSAPNGKDGASLLLENRGIRLENRITGPGLALSRPGRSIIRPGGRIIREPFSVVHLPG